MFDAMVEMVAIAEFLISITFKTLDLVEGRYSGNFLKHLRILRIVSMSFSQMQDFNPSGHQDGY
jgi:hypothetical protein